MSKDIIYREDAIKAINLRVRIPHDIASAQYASMAINAICSVPSADRPQGEWIEEEYKGRIYGIYRCQYKCFHCGYVPMHRGEPIIPTNRTLRFCPNCGARMRPKLQGKHFDSIIIDESAMKGADDE